MLPKLLSDKLLFPKNHSDKLPPPKNLSDNAKKATASEIDDDFFVDDKSVSGHKCDGEREGRRERG